MTTDIEQFVPVSDPYEPAFVRAQRRALEQVVSGADPLHGGWSPRTFALAFTIAVGAAVPAVAALNERYHFFGRAEPPRLAEAPVGDTMGVFDRPATKAVPAGAAARLPNEGPTRVLLDDDELGVQVVARRSPGGRLCWSTSDGGTVAATCSAGGFRQEGFAWEVRRAAAGDGWLVVGLVPDGVEAVTVSTADGNASAAAMGENAFAWRGPAGVPAKRIEARFADGTTRTAELSEPPKDAG